jgi:single-strand DNA-binding protein
LSEIACQYAGKWKKVYIEGRLQTRNWEAQDWTKRYRTEIVWENLILLWTKNEDSEMNNSSTTTAKSNTKAEEEISVEDIPF